MSAAAARRLLRRARSGALATRYQMPHGAADGGEDIWPYASLVTVACDCDAAPLFLLSQLAEHTRNLRTDNRAALLVEEASRRDNPQTGPRVTVLGRIEKSQQERHRHRFLARHPCAALYAGFADFAIYRMTIERAHDVGGFGQARWIEARDFASDAGSAAAIAATETEILRDGNAGDAAINCADRLQRRRQDGWSLIAVDPDGCDLRRGNAIERLEFLRSALDPAGVRQALTELAEEPTSEEPTRK
jgi:heme iron utilization protein